MKREDSIVSPTLSPYTSVDLGARSLVSGVDCNDPEKSPFRFVCYFIFVHHHALSPLHVLSNKINFIKDYFVLLVWFYINPLLSYLNQN
jgi:hypothetical protein